MTRLADLWWLAFGTVLTVLVGGAIWQVVDAVESSGEPQQALPLLLLLPFGLWAIAQAWRRTTWGGGPDSLVCTREIPLEEQRIGGGSDERSDVRSGVGSNAS